MKFNISLNKTVDEIDDGEAEEIAAFDILDYFTYAEVPNVLKRWTRKLKHEGSIVVSFTDMYYIIKAIANRSITLEEANKILHGEPTKKSTLSMQYVADLLQDCGLRIIAKKYVNGKALVRAIRE